MFLLTNTTTDLQKELLIHAWEGIVNCRGDGGDKAHSRAKAKGDQHQEEEDSEDLGDEVKFGEDLGVADKGKAGPGLDHLGHRKVELVSKVAEDGEDNSTGEEGGEGVREADDERVLVGVVSELVIRTVCGQSSESNTEGEEGLGHCCVPNLEKCINFVLEPIFLNV